MTTGPTRPHAHDRAVFPASLGLTASSRLRWWRPSYLAAPKRHHFRNGPGPVPHATGYFRSAHDLGDRVARNSNNHSEQRYLAVTAPVGRSAC